MGVWYRGFLLSGLRHLGHHWGAILAVGIGLKELVEDNLIGIRTADRKSIADHGPLRLAMEAEDLANIVNQASQNEPARMPVSAYSLGSLQQMLNLCKVRVRVAVIDQRIEELHCLPNAHHPRSVG